MHLQAVSNCLSVFAAAGHYSYLQQMSNLEGKHPDVYRKSLKSTGGMTEDMRNLRTLSAPVTSEYNSAMQHFTYVTYITSPQHKDLTEARIKRDAYDLEKIRTKLASCTSDPTLRNIVSGILAGPDICHWIGWEQGEQEHWRYNRKVGIYLQIPAERQNPRVLCRLLLVVPPTRSPDLDTTRKRFLVVSRSFSWRGLTYERNLWGFEIFEARNILRKADKPQLAQKNSRICCELTEAAEGIWKWGRGTWRARSASLYGSSQRGPGAEPLVRRSPPEAERFLGIIRRKDRQYLPLYPTFESAEISPKHCLESKYTKKYTHTVCAWTWTDWTVAVIT